MSPITDYLHSSLILFSNAPTYDDKGRQLPFDESFIQRRERLAFVKSLQWQRNVATWMQNQQDSQVPSTHSPSSSESSSPHTPTSPLNTLDIHTPQQHLPQAALDVKLSKLALAASAAQFVSPPQHRQSRNYKNLHLSNTSRTPRHQPQFNPPLQPKQQVSKPTRSIFDSNSNTNPFLPSYPSAEEDDQPENEEPYLFYSSTVPKRSSTVTTPTAAGIGEFPVPIHRTPAFHMPSSQISSSPSRTLTFSKPPTAAPQTLPTSSRIGYH